DSGISAPSTKYWGTSEGTTSKVSNAWRRAVGFRVKELLEFNRIGTVAWFLNGKIMRRRTFGLAQVELLNFLTPVFRLVDRFLPSPSLSLIACLEPEGAAAGRRGDDRAPSRAVDHVA